MNKRIYTGLLVFLLVLLGGCEKAPINSDIEGMWKLEEYYYRKGTTDSKEPTKLEDLQPYGLNSLETTFEIVKSDGKNMVLRSDYATLTFSKF